MQAPDTVTFTDLILDALMQQLGGDVVIDADTPFSALGIDSIGVVILVAELETQAGFTFDPEDLNMDFFQNARTLARLLTEKYSCAEVVAHG